MTPKFSVVTGLSESGSVCFGNTLVYFDTGFLVSTFFYFVFTGGKGMILKGGGTGDNCSSSSFEIGEDTAPNLVLLNSESSKSQFMLHTSRSSFPCFYQKCSYRPIFES